ncbi:hypothetical protein CWB68_01140 [Pseudoalteromonas sp. S979]|nr:hypothetical protein CWB83_01635 [Pseudoalteromonas sp. S1691]TMS72086.1 hypothetical protein CWB86_03420 [Pseudoalteromonas sp. S1731]TMS75463.1 hypothetical protein CWB88_00445 [Pseudoalteromonas sp. S1941]TMS77684.1 hypothetical protein CWB82_09365 [Pseudoalteromonas sp. S1690]TMS85621.1 hypothetical protein CWB70_09345 [Pseudoalteromonas sp. S981]TMS90248.1 hypothetical protein CWB69_05685 [Pseudoalteromonas sp. S980]TMS98822.1 hypothetical protein CWB68_01140 [Pseudoalteromonas sp. S9
MSPDGVTQSQYFCLCVEMYTNAQILNHFAAKHVTTCVKNYHLKQINSNFFLVINAFIPPQNRSVN